MALFFHPSRIIRASGSRREVKLHAGARRPTDRSAADEGGDCSGQIERIDGLRQERLEPELLHSLGCIALAVRRDGDRRDTAALLVLESTELLDQPKAVLTGHR